MSWSKLKIIRNMILLEQQQHRSLTVPCCYREGECDNQYMGISCVWVLAVTATSRTNIFSKMGFSFSFTFFYKSLARIRIKIMKEELSMGFIARSLITWQWSSAGTAVRVSLCVIYISLENSILLIKASNN